MRVLVHSPVRLFGECVAAFVRTIEFIEAVEVESIANSLPVRARAFAANLALLDITIASSLAAARYLKQRCPEVDTVALAVPDMAHAVIACADAGFVAYVPRDASGPDLTAILQHARRGETKCDPRMARSLFNELARRQSTTAAAASESALTRREFETARLLSVGLSNKEIARELHLSVATVKNHVHSVLQKLRLQRRSQVANRLVEEPGVPPNCNLVHSSQG
jgi:DNA-binding NarL/FixJ family response regulator